MNTIQENAPTMQDKAPAVLSLREKLDPGYQWDYSTVAALERLSTTAEVLREIGAATVYSAGGGANDGAAMHIGWIDFLRFFGCPGMVEEHHERRYHYTLYRGVLITAIED